MKSLSIFGTTSDSGKSFVTLMLTYLFFKQGFKIAPFKAQNMSNNSMVCDDGSEIGIAQFLQADVINLTTSYHLNPILLKPQSNRESQIIIQGRVKKSQDARSYYRDIESLKPIVKESFETLLSKNDFLICEGAGSPVELNLEDLSNIFIATEFKNKIIIVADIERGGVFASIYGTYKLLPIELQKNVIGVIINRFRGDESLFERGVEIIEQDFGLKVLGVLPFFEFNFGFEDSLSLQNYKKNQNGIIKIAIIKTPKLSNFNDFEPLINDLYLDITFISSYQNLNEFDMIILGGTKTTIDDLLWLRSNLLFNEIRNFKGLIFAICGGYQMLFKKIIDKLHIESSIEEVDGFGFIDDNIEFQSEKILKKGSYNLFGIDVKAFEMHNGISKKYPISYQKDNIFGTHLHSIFENDEFREFIFKKLDRDYKPYIYKDFKDSLIENISKEFEKRIDIKTILNNLL